MPVISAGLSETLPQVLDTVQPQIVFYNAGVDPHTVKCFTRCLGPAAIPLIAVGNHALNAPIWL